MKATLEITRVTNGWIITTNPPVAGEEGTFVVHHFTDIDYVVEEFLKLVDRGAASDAPEIDALPDSEG